MKRELENSQVPEMLSAKKQKIQTLYKFVLETDSFVRRPIHISNIVQGTHHQGDILMEPLQVSNACASH